MVVVWVLATSLPAHAQESFYKGKTLRIVVATSAGGGFDAYSRTLARHLGKHIPGNPNMIVENMPGAGHRIGANYVFWGLSIDLFCRSPTIRRREAGGSRSGGERRQPPAAVGDERRQEPHHQRDQRHSDISGRQGEHRRADHDDHQPGSG